MNQHAIFDEILKDAVRDAIEKCGYHVLRSMEFFGTNESKLKALKAA